MAWLQAVQVEVVISQNGFLSKYSAQKCATERASGQTVVNKVGLGKNNW